MNISSVLRTVLVALAFCAGIAHAGAEEDLTVWGMNLSASTPNEAIRFKKVTKTGASRYRVDFETSAASLMSDKNAKNDRVAFLANQGRAKIWEVKACNEKVASIVNSNKLEFVFAALNDKAGEIQSATMCGPVAKSAGAVPVSSGASNTVIGTWYDDVGSGGFLNATFTIERVGGKTMLTRKNGDGSQGSYELSVAGTQYTKIGDKFGAHYYITPRGLDIHDRRGYIRTAKPVR